MNDLVSIITPTYNSTEFIGDTIQGILSQSYSNWELLITDDCSSDNTMQVVKEFVEKDSRIKLYQLEVNSGAGIARNNSISKANGRYIAFCDSDDVWDSEKLTKQITFMSTKNVSLSYTYYREVNEKGDLIKNIFGPTKVYYKQMLRVDYIGFSTSIYDASILGKIFMSSLRKRQDWILLLTILKKIEYGYCYPEVLGSYRVRKDSISSNKLNLIQYIWKVYRENQKFSKTKSCYYIFLYITSYLYKRIANQFYKY